MVENMAEQIKQGNKQNIISSIKNLFRGDHEEMEITIPKQKHKDLGNIDFEAIENLQGFNKLVDLRDDFVTPVKVSIAECDGHYTITRDIHLPILKDNIGVMYIGSQGWKTISEEKNYKLGDYLFISNDAKIMGHVEKEKIGQEWLLIDNKIEIVLKYSTNYELTTTLINNKVETTDKIMKGPIYKVLSPGLYISRLYNYPERQHQTVGIKIEEDFKFTNKNGDVIKGNAGDWLVSSKNLYSEYTFVVNPEDFTSRYIIAEK